MNRSLISHSMACGMLIAAGFGVGCTKTPAPSPTASQTTAQPAAQPVPRPDDGQITAQVQGRLQADSALTNNPIQAQAVNGVVTLSGNVADQAARELAGNDAAQVNGVRTVINNLVVAQPSASASAGSDVSAKSERAAEQVRLRQQREQARLAQQREQARKDRERRQQEAFQQQQEQNAARQQPLTQQAQNTPAALPVPAAQAQPAPPPPPPQPVKQVITIPAGTDLAVRVTENLETGKTQTDDSFHGVLADNLVVNGVTAIHRGANVTGIVLDAKDATHFKGRAQLSLGLQQVQTGGRELSVSTDPLVQQGAARGKNTAEKAGGAALLGTLIGAIAGGGRGALVGAAAGAGTGAGVNAVTRGQQVKIASESVLHFTLNQPLTVTVTRPASGSATPGSRWDVQDNGRPQLHESQPPQ